MLPLRAMGALSCAQSREGRVAIVAPERAVFKTSRRENFDMSVLREAAGEMGFRFYARPDVSTGLVQNMHRPKAASGRFSRYTPQQFKRSTSCLWRKRLLTFLRGPPPASSTLPALSGNS